MTQIQILKGELEFRNIADNLPTLCWMADDKGIVIWRNARWYEYCGMSSTADPDKDWSICYDPEIYNHLRNSWQICISTGNEFKETFPLLGKDGIYRHFLTRAVPIEIDFKIVRWLGVSVDVSEQIRIEKELRESEELLRTLNQTLEIRVEERADALRQTEEQLRQSQKMEAVGQLTGGLAHDFNNLLTGIMGNLELMQLRIQQNRLDGLERFVISARDAGNKAASLTQRLLAFSRRQTLDPKPTHVSDLVEGMADLIERTIGPSIRLTISSTKIRGAVLIDGSQLENALLNLCINSRDALPDGGDITINLKDVIIDKHKAGLFEIDPGSYIEISVSDNGCGMDQKTISKAFDPFFTTKPIGQGTGLGLSMIYGFSRQSKGHVTISSIVGLGTTVSIYLPRPDTTLIVEKDKFILENSPPPTFKGNILLVDDEEVIRQILKEVLEESGYHVVCAGDGIEALKILESSIHLDLLITDVGLPNGMNGKQVADAARVLRGKIPILFITGYAEQSVMGDKGFEDGIELMTKPFSFQDVAKRAEKMIR